MNYIILLIFSSEIFASENSHHGSIADLKFYFVNFFIFVLFIGWKLLPMVRNYFREQHLLMKNHFHTASEKLRLAKVEKDKTDKDLNELDRKIAEMKSASNRDLDVYLVRYKNELEEKLQALEKDLEYQVDFDTMALNNKMYNNLLNKITDKVETDVRASQNEKKLVTEALVGKSGIGSL